MTERFNSNLINLLRSLSQEDKELLPKLASELQDFEENAMMIGQQGKLIEVLNGYRRQECIPLCGCSAAGRAVWGTSLDNYSYL